MIWFDGSFCFPKTPRVSYSSVKGETVSSFHNLKSYFDFFLFPEFLDSVRPLDGPNANLLDGVVCSCPPACSRTTYSPAVTSAAFPNSASKIVEQLGTAGQDLKWDFFVVVTTFLQFDSICKKDSKIFFHLQSFGKEGFSNKRSRDLRYSTQLYLWNMYAW